MLKYNLANWATRAGCKFEAPREGDVGYDLHSAEAITLFPGEQRTITTGLKLQLDSGYVGIVNDRSSLALKQIYTHAGIIDPSYRGYINVLLANHSQAPFHIEPGHRIAQLIILPFVRPEPVHVVPERLEQSLRGEGNFGSTGI